MKEKKRRKRQLDMNEVHIVADSSYQTRTEWRAFYPGMLSWQTAFEGSKWIDLFYSAADGRIAENVVSGRGNRPGQRALVRPDDRRPSLPCIRGCDRAEQSPGKAVRAEEAEFSCPPHEVFVSWWTDMGSPRPFCPCCSLSPSYSLLALAFSLPVNELE
ncbi:hypothetical protein J3F83DRAFT_3935 [Trichoderma novae-zelandiae]